MSKAHFRLFGYAFGPPWRVLVVVGSGDTSNTEKYLFSIPRDAAQTATVLYPGNGSIQLDIHFLTLYVYTSSPITGIKISVSPIDKIKP